MGFGVWYTVQLSRCVFTQGLKDISPTEDARRLLAQVGRSVEISVLFCILFGFMAAGALLYAALQRVGSSVKRLQRRIALTGVLFFSTSVIRFVCKNPTPQVFKQTSVSSSAQARDFQGIVGGWMGLQRRIHACILP